MKKFMYILLSIMVCASFCLCGCSDKAVGNDIIFVDATITHSSAAFSNYTFVFNYVYQNNDAYYKDRVRYDIWFDDAKKSTIACIDANVETNTVKYITPYTSLISEIHIDASFINQHKTLTVQYYVRNKVDNNKIDCVLAQKTFKISYLLSKVTDIP